MTDKLSPGELPRETQYKICANVFKKALDSMLTKGFNPEDAVSGLLCTTLYAMQTFGLNYDHEQMARWLENFAASLRSKKSHLH